MEPKIDLCVLILSECADQGGPISGALKPHGFSSIQSTNTNECLQLIEEGAIDATLIISDAPHSPALDRCRVIRTASSVPILVVCDQAEEVEIVGLLAAGADDCVRRTIGEIELAGRILSAARRAGAAPYHGTSSPSSRKSHRVSTLRAGGVRLDLTTCRVSVGAKTCTLTPNEFRLMAVFLRSPGEVFSREDLRRRVWPNDVHSLHLIEVHIANLRAKIEIDPHRPNHILTVRSRGYKFAVKS